MNREQEREKNSRAGALGLFLFALATVGIHFLPDRVFVEGDDFIIRNMKISEAEYFTSEAQRPKLLIAGSSRLRPQESSAVAKEAGLASDEVLNVSSPGATFFFVNSLLRRYPEMTKELKLIVIDVLPMQLMHGNNFDESSTYFLRYASISQKMNAEKLEDKARAFFDSIIPTWSRSQTLNAWGKGGARLTMNVDELQTDILDRNMADIPAWRNMMRLFANLEKKGKGVEWLNRSMYFPKPDVARNQKEALQNIIDIVPDDCRVALLWLPLIPSGQEKIDAHPRMSESQASFLEFLDTMTDPKLTVHYHRNPGELGIEEVDYSGDGIHYFEAGNAKVTRKIAEMYREQ